MKIYIDHQLSDLMGKIVANLTVNCDPPSEITLTNSSHVESVKDIPESSHVGEDSHHCVSLLPQTDRRSKDQMLKQN